MAKNIWNTIDNWYEKSPIETWPEYFSRFIETVRIMWPRARKHGYKYLWSKRFRKTLDNKRNQDKYGRAFLKNRPEIRRQLFERDGPNCKRCRKPMGLATIDHIKSVGIGGTNDLHNLQLLCEPCHKKKSKIDSFRAYRYQQKQAKLRAHEISSR